MTNQNWRVVAATLAVILAVLGGATIAFVIAPGPGATPTPAGSFALGSPSGGVSPGVSASLPASAPATASAPANSPSPSPAPTPIPIAQMTITQLKLDPRVPASAGVLRFITFTSDGPGTIKAQLKAISPLGTTRMCLRVGSRDLQCKDAANATMTATTTSAHATWRVSLQGTDMFTPTIELTVTFPAANPSLKITHARFDGKAFPETNGIQVIFVPRVAGDAKVVATWGAKPFLYEIDATNQTTGTGGTNLTNQGPSTNTNKSVPVTAAESWKIVLFNASDGLGKVDMTATISWP